MPRTLAVIMAGGKGRRLGRGNKALARLAGRPLAAHVIARLAPQVQTFILNANGDPARYADIGMPVCGDIEATGLDGPFLGLATAFHLFRKDPSPSHLLTVPTDTPFLPVDLVAQLSMALDTGVAVAYPESPGGPHAVITLWTRAGAAEGERRLRSHAGERMDAFVGACGGSAVAFADDGPFFNINRPEDLVEAERRLGQPDP